VGLNSAGIGLSVASGLVDLLSFSFAPQSLLAPLAAVTLIVNLMLAPVVHGEPLSQTDVFATVCVCLGVATCLSFSSSSSVVHTLRSLEKLVFRKMVGVYFSLYVSIMAALAYRVIDGEGSGHGQLKSVAVGYPVLAGMFGGLTTLLAKLITELLGVVSIRSHITLMVFVITLLGCSAVSQITILNKGIGKHSSLFVGPLFTATFVTSNIFNGGIFFNEFASFTRTQIMGFSVGVSLIVGGVTVLATKAGGSKHKT